MMTYAKISDEQLVDLIYAKISDEQLVDLIDRMKKEDYQTLSIGDVYIFRGVADGDEVFEMIRIAERRIYDTASNIVYESVNKNYAPTIS